jgi:signal transduction histidine kinase
MAAWSRFLGLPWRRRTTPALWGVAAAAVGLVLTAWLYVDLRAEAEREHAARVERIADRVVLNLQRETDLAFAFQSSVAAKIASAPLTGADAYRDFIQSLRVFDLLPSIRALAFAPLVDGAGLAYLADRLGNDETRAALGYPAFAPWPEGVRDLYAPMVLVEPPPGNARVYNFDLYSSPERRAAGVRALATGHPQASAPVVLTQDVESGRPGVLVLYPVVADGRPIGLVAMGVTIERLLAPTLQTMAGANSQILIEDIGTASAADAAKLVIALGHAPAGYVVERRVDFAGRFWRVRTSSENLAQMTPLWAALLGSLLSLLAGFLTLRVLGERRALKRAVLVSTRSLRAANRDLRAQAQALVRANAAKSEFLGRLGHELRTPLNAIMGFAEMLKLGVGGGALPPRQAQYVRDVHLSGGHLLALINRLLDTVRLEQGQLNIARVAFDVATEIDAALVMLRPTAARRNVSVVFVRDGVIDLALGDPIAFRQVAVNLIENAIKFTRHEGEIRVALAQSRTHVSVGIDDSGIGIPHDQLSRIFEPFHQVDSGDTRRFGGAGLGLAIVAGLMKEMGGSVSVHSAPGHGSHFRVDLPIAAAAAVAAVGRVQVETP